MPTIYELSTSLPSGFTRLDDNRVPTVKELAGVGAKIASAKKGPVCSSR